MTDSLSLMLSDTIRVAESKASSIWKLIHTNRVDIDAVLEALEPLTVNIVNVVCDGLSIDLHITGNKSTLNTLFHTFRTLGYEPLSRPKEKPEQYYSTWFEHPDRKLQFWINFSSNACVRTKVGIKVQEVDVYETVCE